MTAVVDTSVLIDYLRGHQGAVDLLETERSLAPLHASCRVTVASTAPTLPLRPPPPTSRRLLTRNVRHFPMFPDLRSPYD